MRRGIGDTTKPAGGYTGGYCAFWPFNMLLDECIPMTPAQIRAQQIADLQKTSAPQSAIDAAVAAGDALVKQDAADRPADYQAQIAAANHPVLSQMFGPSFTNFLFPQDVADPNNPQPQSSLLGPLLWIGVGFLGVYAISNLTGGRR